VVTFPSQTGIAVSITFCTGVLTKPGTTKLGRTKLGHSDIGLSLRNKIKDRVMVRVKHKGQVYG